MSTLGTQQEIFSRDMVKLFTYIHARGLEIRIGEVWRPQEMQDWYLRLGKTKTANSQHTKKLAVDIYVFRNGVMVNTATMQEIGRFWESLSTFNRWGGSWRGLVEAGKSSFIDMPHFERKV